MTSVHFVKGDDAVLLSEKIGSLVDQLVGDGDRSLMLEELTEDHYRDGDVFEMNRLVDAAQTPPFLTEKRVVIGRHLGRFSKAGDVKSLIDYLDNPLPSTELILVWEKGESPRQERMPSVPKTLADKLKSTGAQTHSASVPGGKGASAWLDERFAASSLLLTPAAKRMIGDRLGEDRSRVIGLLGTLASTFGPEASIADDDVEPFLGQSGSVPPWELTDAIHNGEIATALDKLHRMLAAGDRHPLQIMASLTNDYLRLLRLDGSGANDEKAVANLLGMKGSTYPAKKLLVAGRKLGSDRVAKAVGLLAQADLDLRGAQAWPDELVMEVLVARLAALGRR